MASDITDCGDEHAHVASLQILGWPHDSKTDLGKILAQLAVDDAAAFGELATLAKGA